MRFIILFFLLILTSNLHSQNAGPNGYPVVGEICPDFVLSDVHYYTKSKVSLNDFKGKWLILDFWNSSCKPCISSFTKLNALQKQFKNDLQFLLVGDNNQRYYPDIKKVFEKLKEYQKLELSVAYDTLLFKMFAVPSVPHVVIIDPNSIVRAVTLSQYVNEEVLKELIAGGAPIIRHKPNSIENEDKTYVNLSIPLLVNGNGGTDTNFLFRSIINKWTWDVPQLIRERSLELYAKDGLFQQTGTILRWLYNIAYFGKDTWHVGDSLYGKVSMFPILELVNKDDFNEDFPMERNIYNYSISYPKNSTKVLVQNFIKKDLDIYFGFKASVETRNLPFLSISLINENVARNLKTKEENKTIEGGVYGYKLKNIPVETLLTILSGYFPFDPPFIDETKLVHNIDISFEANMMDFEQVKNALAKEGLLLEKKKRPMKVLVIRDPEK